MSSFQVQLETATQWDCWIVELESNPKMIIGSKGIAISYIIQENDDPDLEERVTWDLQSESMPILRSRDPRQPLPPKRTNVDR